MLGEYVIVRTENAGVFAGTVERFNEETRVIVLTGARRIWYWDGAASLSQLAQTGTTAPENCKFPTPVSKVTLTQVIEVLSVSDAAKESIASVPVWAV